VGLTLKHWLLAALLWIAVTTPACAKSSTTFVPHTGSAARTKAPGASAKTILVIMPSKPQAESVWSGMKTELSSEFDMVVAHFDDDASVSEMAATIRNAAPACVVLMNNSNVRLYRQYQQSQPVSALFPPAVIVMTSFLQESVKSVKNATGISYEVPGVVQFVKLRSMIDSPIRKVGVVYRVQFAEFIAAQRRLAARDRIELIGYEVTREPSEKEISTALKALVERDHVDAMWVLNDNGLLSPQLLSSVWLTSANPRHRLPVMVGVASLVSKELPVGTFAMLPDHVALGVQVANLIFDLADNGWRVEGREVALPISIRTVVDANEVRQQFVLKQGALDGVEQVAK